MEMPIPMAKQNLKLLLCYNTGKTDNMEEGRCQPSVCIGAAPILPLNYGHQLCIIIFVTVCVQLSQFYKSYPELVFRDCSSFQLQHCCSVPQYQTEGDK